MAIDIVKKTYQRDSWNTLWWIRFQCNKTVQGAISRLQRNLPHWQWESTFCDKHQAVVNLVIDNNRRDQPSNLSTNQSANLINVQKKLWNWMKLTIKRSQCRWWQVWFAAKICEWVSRELDWIDWMRSWGIEPIPTLTHRSQILLAMCQRKCLPWT